MVCNIKHEWAGRAQSVQQLSKAWTIQGINTGGDKIFHIHPDWPWVPPTQSPVQWVPGLIPKGKVARAWH
jgi:hypothetical protein